MNTRKVSLAIAIAAALALPVAAQARSDFNYIEVNYIDVDADFSDTVEVDEGVFSAKTSADSGFQVAGSWELWEGIHLFGEYSSAGQDLTFTANGDRLRGDFDIIRWRLGAGYAMPVSPDFTVYGRVSYDYAEIDSVTIGGLDLGGDDDSGIGAELGALWKVAPEFQLQGWVRYSDVGDILEDFDSDVLFGFGGRWFVTEQVALQAGYEHGEISTWNVGVRFAF
jgi:hypothetical protein